MMLDLGEYQEESVNIIAIMGPHGVYHKDEPIKELEAALQRQGFQTIWPQNSADLLQFIEHNPRICGVIFDWDEYNADLCSDINQLNEYLPLYAFINAHSTMDVSSQDLRMTLWFFEYALGLAQEIAIRIGQYTREYLRSADVCKIFSISNSTLKWLRGTGQIPYYVLGNTFLYRKEDIEAALRPGSILESKELKTTTNE